MISPNMTADEVRSEVHQLVSALRSQTVIAGLNPVIFFNLNFLQAESLVLEFLKRHQSAQNQK